MKSRSPFRRLAWIALLAIAPGIAGLGSVVATAAALASLEGDRAHRVSIQQDGGHDDFVICHGVRDGADALEAGLAAADCADDHRLHVTNIESLISRHDGSGLPHGMPLALAAAPFAEVALRVREARPASAPATFGANRHQRTVVLRI